MGHTKLCPYVIRAPRKPDFWVVWDARTCGRPTAANLEKWRTAFNQSLQPGGANEHLGDRAAINFEIEIFDQRTRVTVCRFNPPMFEMVN